MAVNNSDGEAWINTEASAPAYVGLLSGRRIESGGGRLNVCLPGCGGDIFAPDDGSAEAVVPEAPKAACAAPKPEKNEPPKPPQKETIREKKPAPSGPAEARPKPNEAEPEPERAEIPDIPYDLMTVEQLQAVILAKMAKNGPVTEQMRRDVIENVWHNSLVNWANSFR